MAVTLDSSHAAVQSLQRGFHAVFLQRAGNELLRVPQAGPHTSAQQRAAVAASSRAYRQSLMDGVARVDAELDRHVSARACRMRTCGFARHTSEALRGRVAPHDGLCVLGCAERAGGRGAGGGVVRVPNPATVSRSGLGGQPPRGARRERTVCMHAAAHTVQIRPRGAACGSRGAHGCLAHAGRAAPRQGRCMCIVATPAPLCLCARWRQWRCIADTTAHPRAVLHWVFDFRGCPMRSGRGGRGGRKTGETDCV
jgi:hypothetical protein